MTGVDEPRGLPRPTPFVPACLRTGRCCETVLLTLSPRQLKAYYMNWVNGGPPPELFEVWLIYPMLAGRARGKLVVENRTFYVYGPCKNLEFELKGGVALGKCSIHEDRPAMCRSYPYGHGVETDSSRPGAAQGEKAWMRGCGYKADPEKGTSPAEVLAGLVPLSEEEK